MNVLVIDDGVTLRGYDCRDVLRVEEPAGLADTPYVVHLGRAGVEREVGAMDVLGFHPLSAGDIRPLPEVLKARLGPGESPWAVGIVPAGLCLLY